MPTAGSPWRSRIFCLGRSPPAIACWSTQAVQPCSPWTFFRPCATNWRASFWKACAPRAVPPVPRRGGKIPRMRIGSWTLPHPVFAAPMAGVTDRPYRRLCKALGAAYAVSEMAASNPRLWNSVKTSRRINHEGEPDPVAVQIAGSDPEMMAEAARFNIEKGAQVIDINRGCAARKVCDVDSGSAVVREEGLVGQIVRSVVEACRPYEVPVTLKSRTGWDRSSRNAVRIGQLAQDAGIAALTLHGRTRCDF